MPADRLDPSGLPFWRLLHLEDSNCKCLEIDQLSLAERIGDVGAADLFLDRKEMNLVSMCCRFEMRRKGGASNGGGGNPLLPRARDWVHRQGLELRRAGTDLRVPEPNAQSCTGTSAARSGTRKVRRTSGAGSIGRG